MSASTLDLPALLALARDKGHTPSRSQMRQALALLDEVGRDDAQTLEAFILRCDSEPPGAAMQLDQWSFPERALRLAFRLGDATGKDPRALWDAVKASLRSARQPLFRQALRAVGRYGWADLIEVALQDPRVLQDAGLKRIALDSAAKCAGQSAMAKAWVETHGQDNAKAQLLAQREHHRSVQASGAWQIPADAHWLAGVVLRLRFKEGMHDWVIAQVKRNPGISLLKIGRGTLWLRCPNHVPYQELLSWRSVMDHAFALPTNTLEGFVRSERMQAQLRALFGDAPISFRVHTQGQGRSESWNQGAAVMKSWPQLVNDPKQSDVELGIQEIDGVPHGWVRPNLRERDHRFDYRVAEIPAASHPTVAAGLAAAAQPRPEDRIWDPFAGSGLELIEAGLLGRCELLLGTDLDAEALDGARQNAAAAKVDLQLLQADAGTVKLPSITKVISNPPHGRRVAQNQDLEGLYRRVLANAFGALVPGGEIHWLTVQPRWGREYCDQCGGHSEILGRIDLGGIVVFYQRITKSTPSRWGPRPQGRAR